MFQVHDMELYRKIAAYLKNIVPFFYIWLLLLSYVSSHYKQTYRTFIFLPFFTSISIYGVPISQNTEKLKTCV